MWIIQSKILIKIIPKLTPKMYMLVEPVIEVIKAM
jgi:hypothetical protein